VSFIGSKTEINTEDIEMCSGYVKQENIYRLNDAIMSGDRALALKILEELIQHGKTPRT